MIKYQQSHTKGLDSKNHGGYNLDRAQSTEHRAQSTEHRAQSTEHRATFCALHNILNEHIIKDHGLLSWAMHEYHGYTPIMATYQNDTYENIKYLPGLKMEFIPRRTGNFILDACAWLRKNAKRIDVLFIYHVIMRRVPLAMTYKFFNPKGKIYIKFDGWHSSTEGSFWKRPFYRWLMRNANCVSTELEYNSHLLSKDWGRKVIWVPNPANPSELQEVRPFSQRSNTILTVGRLGTRQKATEILLEAFAKVSALIPEWTLKLAGRLEENLNIAKDFYASHPELIERVLFTGQVRDRQELMELYRDAKIFAFPSRHESFGIALTEAMMQGCFPVVSRIATNEYHTDNYKFALSSDVDDVDGLAQNLLYACTHEAETERLALEGMNITRQRLDLRRCSDAIEAELN